VPDNAVNWQEVDRVSVVQPLPDGRSLIIDRYFAKVADDPLEGRRERVVLADRSGRRLILENDCVDPAGIRTQRTYIAFECVREQAGDHLLHSVVVFDGTGRKIIETQRCRDPKWAGERVIACDAESVGPDGRLKLQARHIGLNSGKDVL
jgi:hypothetical protein